MFLRIFLTTILVISFPIGSFASESIILTGASFMGPNQYFALMGGNVNTAITDGILGVFPTNGNFTKLTCGSTVPAGGGKSFTFTLYKGTRASMVATGLTCAIGGSDDYFCSDETSVSVSAGDLVVMRQEGSGGPSADYLSCSIVFDSTTADETVMIGTSFTDDAGAKRYGFMAGYSSIESSKSSSELLMPFNATIKKLYVERESPVLTGKTRVFTVQKEGTNQSLTCTLSAGDTTCNDTSNLFTVNAGETLTVENDGQSGDNNVKYTTGVVAVPTTSGVFGMYTHSGTDQYENATTEYLVPSGGSSAFTSTEANRAIILAKSITMTDMFAELNTSQAGGTIAFSYEDGDISTITHTTLNVSMSSGSTANQTGQSLSIVEGNWIVLVSTPSSTPLTRNVRVSAAASVNSDSRRIIIISEDPESLNKNKLTRAGWNNSLKDILDWIVYRADRLGTTYLFSKNKPGSY